MLLLLLFWTSLYAPITPLYPLLPTFCPTSYHFNANSNEGNNLNTACYSNASSSEIVAGGTNIFGGTQPDLLCINAGSGTILRRVSWMALDICVWPAKPFIQVPSTAPITCVRRSNLVVCGQADGRIVLRDPRSLRAEQTITAHTNGLSALEVQGNCLLSIGYTIRSAWALRRLRCLF